jgi:hypothetical protein
LSSPIVSELKTMNEVSGPLFFEKGKVAHAPHKSATATVMESFRCMVLLRGYRLRTMNEEFYHARRGAATSRFGTRKG